MQRLWLKWAANIHYSAVYCDLFFIVQGPQGGSDTTVLIYFYFNIRFCLSSFITAYQSDCTLKTHDVFQKQIYSMIGETYSDLYGTCGWDSSFIFGLCAYFTACLQPKSCHMLFLQQPQEVVFVPAQKSFMTLVMKNMLSCYMTNFIPTFIPNCSYIEYCID